MPYPRPSNIPVTRYHFDVSRVPVRIRIETVSPFYYDGNDTRLIYAKVVDNVVLPNGRPLMPKGSMLFGRQNKETGIEFLITRYQQAGWDEWTLASGIAEVGMPGKYRTAFLSSLAVPKRPGADRSVAEESRTHNKIAR